MKREKINKKKTYTHTTPISSKKKYKLKKTWRKMFRLASFYHHQRTHYYKNKLKIKKKIKHYQN